MKDGEGDRGWELPFDSCQRHNLDLETLLPGILYQRFDTLGNFIGNPTTSG